MAEEIMADRWDPFLDAFAEMKEIVIAYDVLCDEAIKEVPKGKRDKFEEELMKLRKAYNG